MAVHKGVDGSIMMGVNVMAHINSWEMSPSGDALEATDFGDKDRVFLPGLRNHAVTFAGHCESTQAAQLELLNNMKSSNSFKSVQAILLKVSTAGAKAGWAGKGPMTGLAVGNVADGLASISGTIQISGGMTTYATSTSTSTST